MCCRSVQCFERLNTISEGAYGVVYRAREKSSGRIVALKKVKMEKEFSGFPVTSIREMNILLSIKHPNIVNVTEIVIGHKLNQIYMVMEYMDHDIKALMQELKQPFSQAEVKCLMKQLLQGIKCLHQKWIMHRDIKTANLLYNNEGILKLCDFGLARKFGDPIEPYTSLVVTLWYRAPEILLGAKTYVQAADIWSCGCIMAELLTSEPLFPAKTEIEAINMIFSMLGTPNDTEWPGWAELSYAKLFKWKPNKKRKLHEKFPRISFASGPYLSSAGLDLLERFLTFNPEKRITAEDALNHAWFHESPRPQDPLMMPTFPSLNEHNRQQRNLETPPDILQGRLESEDADAIDGVECVEGVK